MIYADLLRRLAPYVIALAVVLGSLYAAYRHGVSVTLAEWHLEREQLAREAAEATATAERKAREEEARRQVEFEGVGNDAKQKEIAADADAAGSVAAGERLHIAASVLAGRASECPKDSAATERSQATTRAAMVLSDLLRRADERAGELAKAYDRARIAGLACEAAVDALR